MSEEFIISSLAQNVIHQVSYCLASHKLSDPCLLKSVLLRLPALTNLLPHSGLFCLESFPYFFLQEANILSLKLKTASATPRTICTHLQLFVHFYRGRDRYGCSIQLRINANTKDAWVTILHSDKLCM